MEGREELTIGGPARPEQALRDPQDVRHARPQRVSTCASAQAEALRVRLIAATVEHAAEGSDPRLHRTVAARKAP